ncbi:hypothetical protein, partial [Rubneribacter badeniensis]|uniref:hypothetical protein n=1 Tax=Rubneribacter badeniensis TaxID=2070688 RepID=UPI00195CF613
MPDRQLRVFEAVFEAVVCYGNGIEDFSRYFIEKAKQMDKSSCFATKWGCGQKVGHSGVRIGVRMYPLETRELAVEAVAAGFSLTEAAE